MAGDMQYHNEDILEYNNQLRQGILEAYTGIFQGVSPARINHWLYSANDQTGQPNAAQISFIIEFIEKIVQDEDARDEGVTKAAIGLLGDMASTIQNIGTTLKGKNFYVRLIQESCASGDESLANTARWAGVAIQNCLQMAG